MQRDDGRPSRFERALDRIPFLEKELLLLKRVVHPGDVCLDIGAAGGAHLLVMARRVGPTGQVHGFEPRPNSLRALRAVVKLSGMADRIVLHQVALSDQHGSEALRVPVVPTRAHFRGTTRDTKDAAAFSALPHKTVEVPTRTLDGVVDRCGLTHVDVIKCDVEGAELLVLAGARRTLERFRPLVVLEADDLHQARYDATAADVLDAVKARGYRVFRYRREGLDEVDGPVEGEDDYVFVPDERIPPLPVRRRLRRSTTRTSVGPDADGSTNGRASDGWSNGRADGDPDAGQDGGQDERGQAERGQDERGQDERGQDEGGQADSSGSGARQPHLADTQPFDATRDAAG